VIVKDESLEGNKDCGQRDLREEKKVMTLHRHGKLRIRSEMKGIPSLTMKSQSIEESKYWKTTTQKSGTQYM